MYQNTGYPRHRDVIKSRRMTSSTRIRTCISHYLVSISHLNIERNPLWNLNNTFRTNVLYDDVTYQQFIEQSTFELYNQAVGTIASSTGSAGSYLELDSMGNVGHCQIWIDSERPKGFEQLFQLE